MTEEEEQVLCEEAKRVGRSHGWDHANYEAAYGKAPKQPPGTPGAMAKTMPWKYKRGQGFAHSRVGGNGTHATEDAYKRGWQAGVRQYRKEHPDG